MARSSSTRQEWRSESGNVAIIAGGILAVLLAFGALVVDVGNLFRVRNELQNAADAAALAGAWALDGTLHGKDGADTTHGLTVACQRARAVALSHLANNTSVTVANEDIALGRWYFRDLPDGVTDCERRDPTQASPTPCFLRLGTCDSLPPDPMRVTTVRVSARRIDTDDGDPSNDNAVGLYLGAFVAHNQNAGVAAVAVAVGGGPSEQECAFPMVVSSCEFEKGPTPPCQICFSAAADTNDTMGWTSFSPTPPVNTGTVDQVIRDTCGTLTTVQVETDEGTETRRVCTGCSTPASTDGEISVDNGSGVLQAANSACEAIENALLYGSEDGTPQPFWVKVPVIAGSADCSSTKFVGTKPVEGFATVKIYGVACGKSCKTKADCCKKDDPECLAAMTCWNGDCVTVAGNIDESPCSGLKIANDAYVLAELECNAGSTEPPGGGFYNTEADRVVRLVK